MIQARALEPIPDLCCLPTPHRVQQYVAGMAFNFSKIELSHHRIGLSQNEIERKAPVSLPKTLRAQAPA